MLAWECIEVQRLVSRALSQLLCSTFMREVTLLLRNLCERALGYVSAVQKSMRFSSTFAMFAGFLGQNGSGKSSLLRILAGKDKEFQGDLFKADGINVAYLEQEPRLDSGPTVDDNIRPALARMQAILDEYNQVNAPLTVCHLVGHILTWFNMPQQTEAEMPRNTWT